MIIVYYTEQKRCDQMVNGYPVLTNEGKIEKYAYAAAHLHNNKYFIKYYNGKLIDPMNMYSIDLARKDGTDSVWKWREVTETIFKSYINFLKTGVERLLIQAERAML